MAEAKEVRHAGIGLDLSINGLDDFKRANSMMDDFLETMKEASRITDKFKNNFSGFGGKSSDEVRKTRDAVQDVYHSMDSAKNETSQVTENVHKMQQEFKYTSDAAKKIKLNSGLNNEAKKDADTIHKVQDELRDLPTKKVTEIKTNFDNSNKSTSNGSKLIKDYSDHVDKAHERVKRLHDIIFGSFVGTAVSNGIQNLASGIWSSAKNGFELAEAGERITSQWKTIGITSKQTEELGDQIGDIRSKADMSGGAIDSMQKKLYALTNSVPVTKTLTNEMAAYGSEAGKTGEQIQQMTGMVVKSLGSKTVSAGFFNRVFGQMPALRKQIQEASGMTNSAFNKALQNSKISGTQMQSWMIKAAKGSGSAWKAFGKTTAGQIAAIKGEWQNLEVAFAKPLSVGFSKGMNSMTGRNGGLKSARKELENIVKLLGTKVGDFAGKAVAFIGQHHGDLNKTATSLFSIVKNLAIGAWKPIASIIKTIGGQSGKASKGLHGFGDALNAISKHKRAIQSVGMVLAGMFAAKKLLDMGTGIWRLRKYILEFTSSTRLMGAAIKLLPWALWIAGITAAIVVLVKLYQHDKKFRKFVNGILSSAKKLASGTIKQFSNLWGDAKKIFGNGFKVIEKATNGFIDLITGHWGNLKKDLISYNKAMFKLIKSVFKGAFDYLDDLTDGKLGKMVDFFSNAWHRIGKGWKSFWNGISDWFGDLWKGIVKHVQNGINNVIKVLNSGISGIDSVIHAFGGSSKAIGTINLVHLATGTGALSGQRRAITKPTLAMLNDGHDSPETGNREMLIHPNGMSELIKGTNVKRLLEPGAEILNASETKFALSLNGMSHFAKGTGLLSNLWNGAKSIGSSVVGGVEKGFGAIGNFAGGVVKATKKVFDTVKSIVKDPSKYLTGLLKKPSGKGTVLSDFANGFFGKMKSSATNWWKSLWGMVNLDGGSADGGNWLHNPGLSETNGFGASRSFGSHDGVDFSGPLGSAIRAVHGGTVTHVGRPLHGWPYSQLGDVITVASNDGWQEIYQEFGGMNNVKVGAGDVIKTGQRIATLGRLNGAGSGSHVHIGVSHGSLWDHGGSSTKGWYDVTKMHGKSDGAPKSSNKSASSGIQSLIKKQVGSGFFKFMSKLANKFGDNAAGSYGNPAGDGVSRWRKYVVKALKANGFSASPSQISAWMRVIARESNGNPKAINKWDSNAKAGHPSKGLVQTIDSTFNAYKFKGHGQIYNGFDDLLAGINYMKHIYGKGPSAFARVSGPEGYARGGHINRNKLSIVGEKGWELFKPDTAGTVIPHEASEKIFNGQNKKVSIDARTNLTIQGHADSSTINRIDERIEKRNNDLVEKMRQLLGSNDEGGLTV
ncbi:hypothetical protein EFS03_03430 [Lentilactobacillus buchneri]|uniref:peptidoglycan DD-metalloendopeptidase family protein n=1 Tax=Lentilactobacillus buchneri TaxID=1581 RepID=UPI0021A77509|nr:peptidoglycan DD-metalloendopeptidase family protein [Lentilactobacillus buchneri]MCT3542045.1 hypothetical protein [Lentilactobacillus buchneri]